MLNWARPLFLAVRRTAEFASPVDKLLVSFLNDTQLVEQLGNGSRVQRCADSVRENVDELGERIDVTLDVDVKLVVVDEAVMELCVWLPVNVLVVLEVPVVSVPVVCVPEVAVAVNVPVLIEVIVTDVCVPVPLVAVVV